jgi:hypothetical protein
MKVRYLGATQAQVDYCGDDPRPVLTVGAVYDVRDEQVGPWNSIYGLHGIDGWFNTVAFEEVPEAAARYVPRPPTEQELQELCAEVGTLGYGLGSSEGPTIEDVRACAIAVFDHYMTDSPGYMGKVLMVVWPGAPCFFDVFTWMNGKIRREEQDG